MGKREIKFRAWDRANEKMFYNPSITFGESGWGVNLPLVKADTQLMQFTGLHDKNKKDIYEGDILRVKAAIAVSANIMETEELEQEIICSVYYNNDVAGFDLKTIERDTNLGGWSFYGVEDSSTMEIIGNLYENPELIKT